MLKGHLELLLLSVVDSGVVHGYAIVEELRRSSAGTFDLPDGTVYPALHRLTDAGLLKARWDDTGARRRRVYALTARGRRELARRRAEWTRFEQGVHGVLALVEQ
jgi:DNA-binding PadR family transcriptional regulator